MSPPGRRLPNREANKLRVITRSPFCSGVHQSRRISNEQKSKSDQKKRVPEIAFTHSTSSNVRSPVLGARKITPMVSALGAGADTIGQISAKLRTDKQANANFLEPGLLDQEAPFQGAIIMWYFCHFRQLSRQMPMLTQKILANRHCILAKKKWYFSETSDEASTVCKKKSKKIRRF